jgi:hypothetical protein
MILVQEGIQSQKEQRRQMFTTRITCGSVLLQKTDVEKYLHLGAIIILSLWRNYKQLLLMRVNIVRACRGVARKNKKLKVTHGVLECKT